MTDATPAPAPARDPDSRPWHRKKRYRVPIWLIAVLAAFVGLALYIFIVKVFGRAQARDLSHEEWLASYAADVEALRDWNLQLDESVASLEELAATPGNDVTRPLTPEQADSARAHWGRIIDLAQSIDRSADANRDFVVLLQKERRGDHIKAFLFCDTADLTVQAAALRISACMAGRARWESLLNEVHPELGIPQGSFDKLKIEIINPERTARQWAAVQYFVILRGFPEYRQATTDEDTTWLLARNGELHAEVGRALKQRGIDIAMNQSKDFTGDLALKAWFPVQKNVANAMGNIKIQRKDVYLMAPEQRAELKAKLQPGDIGVTRKNWYLSNAGIPGFWPHAVMHVGTPKELEAFALDTEVRAWCTRQPEGTDDFTKLLAARHPAAWKRYTSPYVPTHGPRAGKPSTEENCFAESIAEGATFRPAEETLSADSLAFLRPRATKAETACAIARAFSHFGKPYDYKFDFVTDNELVCSELVYKSYQPATGFRGLDFPVENVLGHPIVTPNSMVRVFDEQCGTPNQQLDFIAFLDADERAHATNWSTEAAFRKTWKRPRWTAANMKKNAEE